VHERRGAEGDAAVRRAFRDPSKDWAKGRAIAEKVYGSCTRAVILRYSPRMVIDAEAEFFVRGTDWMVDQELHVRCRRCPSCLRARQYLWALRAEAEVLLHRKTLFFTGTFAQQTKDLEVINDECTKWLKRVRRRCDRRGTKLRYLLVPERHKSGNWHVHALLHSNEALTTRMAKEGWNAGFTVCKVADRGSARYVTKYVAKDLLEDQNRKVPRIRASRAPTYGGWVMVRDKELVEEMLRKRGDEGIQETWTKNLKMLIQEMDRTTSPERILQYQMMATVARPQESGSIEL
jgi:site-specific recombinase